MPIQTFEIPELKTFPKFWCFNKNINTGKIMKKIFLLSTALALTISFQSCEVADKKSSTKKDSVSGDTNMVNGNHVAGSEVIETGLDEAGGTFLRKAAVGGIMEVEAAKIAATNASSQKVKDFAAKMLADHSKANKELKELATKKKIITPDALPAEDQMHLDQMKKLTGAEFDKHYMGMMVTDHEKTVALFKDGAQNKDASLKQLATKTLAVIQQHDVEAKEISQGLK